jgi:hypothetical protein
MEGRSREGEEEPHGLRPARLKPEEVLPEWHKSLAAVGARRTCSASPAARWPGSVPGSRRCGRGFKAPLGRCPRTCASDSSPRASRARSSSTSPTPRRPRCRSVQRSHPLVSVLAETLLERTLASAIDERERPGRARPRGLLGRPRMSRSARWWRSCACGTSSSASGPGARRPCSSKRPRRSPGPAASRPRSKARRRSPAGAATGGRPARPCPRAAVQQALAQLETRVPELDAFARASRPGPARRPPPGA